MCEKGTMRWDFGTVLREEWKRFIISLWCVIVYSKLICVGFNGFLMIPEEADYILVDRKRVTGFIFWSNIHLASPHSSQP